MIGFSIFLGLLAFFIFRRFWKESDLDPILWKWLVRLIWFGSTAFFQVVEFLRYLDGLSYRPFFGLYAGILFAAVVWFTVRLLANVGRRWNSVG